MLDVVCSIVNHGHHKHIQLLLNSFDEFVDKSDSDIKVVITNNKVCSGDRFVSKRFNLVYIDNETNKGFGENHNFAFDNYSSSHFAVMNPDLLFTQKFKFSDLAKFKNTISTPLIVTESGLISDFRRLDPTPFNLAKRYLGLDVQPHLVTSRFDWVSGCFMVFNSSLFEALSGFDPKYFMYLEDADICKRARRLGANITVNTDVRVCHFSQHGSRKELSKFLIHIRSLIRFWIKF